MPQYDYMIVVIVASQVHGDDWFLIFFLICLLKLMRSLSYFINLYKFLFPRDNSHWNEVGA